MPIAFSSPLVARLHGDGDFRVKALPLASLGDKASPVLLLDDFRVRGQPFAPHPHAGFSAVTYVFEDSPASLRSRDSLGHDVIAGPGGLVWTKAGRGVTARTMGGGDFPNPNKILPDAARAARQPASAR